MYIMIAYYENCVFGWQFKAPVANVWVLHNQKVTEVSLFSSRVIPEFMMKHAAADDEDLAEESSLPDVEPLLYIGLFVCFIYCLTFRLRCFCFIMLYLIM